MNDTLAALHEYRTIIDFYKIDNRNILATATEAARRAENSRDFFVQIKNKLNFDVKIITGNGEAYYTALGICKGTTATATASSIPPVLTIIDIGGASTEFIKVQTSPFKILSSISLPVGAVLAAEWEREQSFDFNVDKILTNKELVTYKTEHLIGAAGTMTSLAAMILGIKQDYQDDKVNGFSQNFSAFEAFIKSIEIHSPEYLEQQFSFLGKRAQTITAGGKIACKIGQKLSISTLQTTTFGLRHGTLFQGEILPIHLASYKR
ncbi:MAG: hypothetical protein A2451_03725 [Bdellovibrionales bacterium RIFOXYC2_FULL_39_8]|nr:MAG: hypothetical protein A2451_03725 [Bdellovibrionales bacterium RIFOXYC2_FULL_39_8]